MVSYFSGVISDDENETSNQDNPVAREDMPDGSRTPPTCIFATHDAHDF